MLCCIAIVTQQEMHYRFVNGCIPFSNCTIYAVLFEDKALFELTLDCLRFNPNDRIRKENLIEHKFFHSALLQIPVRVQPQLNHVQELVSHDLSKYRNAKIN